MGFRNSAMPKSSGKADIKRMAMTSAAPKRMANAKKSAPPKKPAAAKRSNPKKAEPASKKTAAVKKPEAVKKAAKAPVAAVKPAPAAAPRLATPIPSNGQMPAKPTAPAAKSAPAGAASLEERRKAATRKFFARLRSLEAIVGADLRKRGSLVLMQAVDQWYNEAINANATEVSITNAAKAVIAQL